MEKKYSTASWFSETVGRIAPIQNALIIWLLPSLKFRWITDFDFDREISSSKVVDSQ